jgi:hypothetical protein
MPEFPMLTGTPFLIVMVLAVPLGFLVSVVLFRAACDLCTVEPPGFLKSCLLVLLLGVVNVPVAFGLLYGFRLLGEGLHLTAFTVYSLASVACIPLLALVEGVLYIPLLRVRFLKGATISVIRGLLGLLVTSVLILLIVGGITIVQGINRLS